MQLILLVVGAKSDCRKLIDLGVGIEVEAGKRILIIVEQVRVRAFTQPRALVIRFEAQFDFLGLVGKVQHHCLFFARIDAVEARKRLHGMDAAQLLIHIHGMQQRLVKAGLELVGDDQETVLVALEGLCRLRFRQVVHAGFGKFQHAIFDRP